MFIIGLTGSIATGKSTVVKVLRSPLYAQHVGIVDCDAIAQHIYDPGTPTYHKLVKEFGEDILNKNEEGSPVDRAKLGRLVFEDAGARRKLNSITHPPIIWEMVRQTFMCFVSGKQRVLLDVPLLYESKTLLKVCSNVVVVYTDPKAQLTRLVERDDCTEEEARKKINSQMSCIEKKKLADHVIDNSGSREDTVNQVHALAKELGLDRGNFVSPRNITLLLCVLAIGCLGTLSARL